VDRSARESGTTHSSTSSLAREPSTIGAFMRDVRITAVILTLNEERHLARCIESVRLVATQVVVVDSFSSDKTIEIAKNLGAIVLQHEWSTHAKQFNWAIRNIADPQWILRIDADEYLTSALVDEIRHCLPRLAADVNGLFVGRRMAFQGRLIRHGGVFPIQVLRLFRHGHGQCEDRWMDEHIKVDGRTVSLRGELIDDNLQSLSWWTDKHNRYSSLEALDLLNVRYGFLPHDSVGRLEFGNRTSLKRWIKEHVYVRLPSGTRALAYFLYRYVFRFGFLDGREGTAFHFLQAFWYRYLVDAKINEVEKFMRSDRVDIRVAIREVLGVRI
jgi:glycosyltransferase involved in cell wall biosynthesis